METSTPLSRASSALMTRMVNSFRSSPSSSSSIFSSSKSMTTESSVTSLKSTTPMATQDGWSSHDYASGFTPVMIQESRSDDDTTLSGSTGGEDVPQSIASLIRSSLLLSSSSSSSSYGSSFTSSFTSPLFDVTQDDGNDDDQLLVSEQGSSFNDTLFASASSLPSSSLSPSFVTKSFLAENDSSLSTNFSKVSSERSSLDSSSSSAFTLSEYFTSLTAPQTLSYASSSMSLPLQSILTPTNQTFLAESNSSLYSLYHEDNPFEDPITNLDSRINDGSLLPFANNSTGVVDFKIHHPILAIILGIMCLCVIFGNVLVMIAIRRERYLQTVTNYFVASLAAADCLVGLVVMPFSVVHEVMNKSWIFGQDWCDLWHSLDVLASTASILNLCVISMDRYWAITDPLSYPCKLTSKRAKVLIAVVWTCSSLISFPAIIWWRATSEADPPEYSCLFTEDIGYLVFSSIISFYGPLTVMIYVYYRIYRAATEQTRAIKLGSKNVCMVSRGKTKEEPISSLNSPGNKGNTGGYCEENGPVVLRIHRGGFTSLNQANQIMESQMNGLAGHHPAVSSRETIPSSSGKSLNRFSSFFKKKTNNKDRRHDKAKVMSRDVNDHKDDIDGKDNSLKLAASRTPSNPAEDIPGSSSSPNNNITSRMNDASTKSSMDTARAAKNLKAWSMGKRFSKLAKEKKAAKTLGIVMGVFILCWLPFFVTNILMGVCPDSCISDPELVGSIVTWLGWLNSGMNPVIYACWSRDFRRAFKRILCSCCSCSVFGRILCCRSSSMDAMNSSYGSSAYYGTPAAAAAAAVALTAATTGSTRGH